MAWLAWLEWAAMRAFLYLVMAGSVLNLPYSPADNAGVNVSAITFVLALGFLAVSSRGNRNEDDQPITVSRAAGPTSRA